MPDMPSMHGFNAGMPPMGGNGPPSGANFMSDDMLNDLNEIEGIMNQTRQNPPQQNMMQHPQGPPQPRHFFSN